MRKAGDAEGVEWGSDVLGVAEIAGELVNVGRDSVR